MNKHIRVWLLPIGLACLAGVVALGTGLFFKQANAAVVQERLNNLAAQVASQVKERIGTYEYGLRGARGLIIGTTIEGLNREKFLRYALSRELDREFPGSRGFGYIARVPEEQEADFIKRARADGRPDFSIRQLSPHPGDRFVIQYIEPEDQNREAVGLDIASEQSRRETALAAISSGQVSLTEPITLVQASGKPLSGFLLLLPVFREGSSPRTREGRLAATLGWTYTPIVIDEVLQSLRYQGGEYDLTLYDATDSYPAEGIRFFSSRPELPSFNFINIIPDETLQRTVYLQIYSRVWAVEVAASTAFLRHLNLRDPRVAAAGAAGLSVLAALLLLLLFQNGVRRRQSRIERERLAMLVENSGDAIIGHTRTGIISSWNRSAERLFGYAAADAIGREFGPLIIPPGKMEEDEMYLASAIAGNSISSYPTVCLNRIGSSVDVSMTMAPIRTTAGQVIGVIRTIRDIGEAKSFEAKLIALNNSLEQQVVERTIALDERNRQLESTSNSFQRIIESAPYAMIVVDHDGRIEMFNSPAELIFGYKREEMLQKPVETLIPEQFRSTHPQMSGEFLKNPRFRPMGQGRNQFARRSNGEVFPVEIGLSPLETPQGLKVVVALIDITQRKENEAIIQRFSAFQEAILSYAGFAIIATDPAGIITLFNPAAEQMLGYAAAEIVGKASPEVLHVPEEVEARARELSAELGTEIPAGFDAFVAKARLGRIDEHEWTYVRKDGSRLPILLKVSALFKGKSDIIGYLGIAVDLTERNENARKLASYSEHLGEMVVERTRELEAAQTKLLSQERFQQDLRLAAEIQENLLPQAPPQTGRYDLSMFAKPARFVSGDVYDVVAQDEETVFIFLADISGKGIPAALMTSAARTLFKQGIRLSRSPAAILAEIEEMLAGDLGKSDLFMTCQICRLDYRSGTMVYVNAGHTETLVHRPVLGTTNRLVSTDLPVGVEAPPDLEKTGEQRLAVRPGDIIVFYSDGLTEMTDPAGELFGVERLKATVSRNAGVDSGRLLDIILEEIKAFGEDKEAEDDISIMIVRVLPSTITGRWSPSPAGMEAMIGAVVEPCRGYGSVFSYELELLASELVSNVIRHAYGLSFDDRTPAAAGIPEIETRLRLEESGIIFEMFDRGREFEAPAGFPGKAAAGELSEGGYGLSILSGLSDRISYERRPEGVNHWRIVKISKEAST